MLSRYLTIQDQSFFLFGPRGIGKSTWIRQNYPKATFYDLLSTREFFKFHRDPGLLYDELKNKSVGEWVVIDEVQKIPQLLDEVHRLIEERGLKFILSGSSARKLKRSGANLLAGRARHQLMFPLVYPELPLPIHIDQILTCGLLPIAYTGSDAQEYLISYVDTYLKEEIKAEALTRNISSFARFLEIAARQNSKVTNMTNIARDAMVARTTVATFFEVLVDTLMGVWVNPWKLNTANKQVAHSKFYFFDTGVVRALLNKSAFPMQSEETGGLFETYILHELRACLAYHKIHVPIKFYQTQNQVEVDFIIELPHKIIGIEVKSTKYWDNKFNRGFMNLKENITHTNIECLGVFLGERSLGEVGKRVYCVQDFLEYLWKDDLMK